jgi:hypothetical protein
VTGRNLHKEDEIVALIEQCSESFQFDKPLFKFRIVTFPNGTLAEPDDPGA